MARPTDVILKVLLTLDYMKLCVDHEKPLGGGVPVDIVVMPDIVIDVDGAAITQLNTQKERDPAGLLAPAEVGSRAGRVLSILSHLRDLDDEGFHLHYIGKTGRPGRAVLEDRLNKNLRENHLQPLRFPFLVPAKQTRYAVLGRNDYYPVGRQVFRHNEDTLLTSEELIHHFYTPIEKIRNAGALYFATDSLAQFNKLIHIAILGETESPTNNGQQSDSQGSEPNHNNRKNRHIFIDLSAIHYDGDKDVSTRKILDSAELKDALDKFRTRSTQTGSVAERTSLTFILKKPEHDLNPKELFETLGMPEDEPHTLLVNDDGTMSMYCFNGVSPREHTINFSWDSNRPYGREAFVAGLLLYRAVDAAWECIPQMDRLKSNPSHEDNWTKDLFPDPYARSTGRNEWPFSEAVEFGKILTRQWEAAFDGVRDKRALLCYIAEGAKDDWQITKWKLMEDKLANVEPADWFLGVSVLAANWIRVKGAGEAAKGFVDYLQGIATGDYLAEHPESWGENQSEVLRIASYPTVRSQFALQTLRRMAMANNVKEANWAGERTAFLTDLDGTLIQSSGLRAMCLRRAFLAMLGEGHTPDWHPEKFPVLPSRVAASGDYQPISPDGKTLSVSHLLDRCVDFYQATVYEKWEDWQQVLKDYPYYSYGELPRDFRQVWNHPLSYPLFIWILQELLKKREGALADLTPMGVLTRAWTLKIPEGMDRKEWITGELDRNLDPSRWETSKKNGKKEKIRPRELLSCQREIARWEAMYKRTFESAIKSYWEVEYEPFSQARETLRTLRDVFGVRLYVATEGHHDTQISKLRTVGLDDFFSEAVTMSTGAAAKPYEDLRIVEEEIEKREKDIISWENFEREHPDIEKLVNEVVGKRRSELSCLRFYEKQWKEFEKKEPGIIYGLMVSSVMVEPNSPFLALTNLRHLELKLESALGAVPAMRFAMVGDRESRDIRPILKCWGKPNLSKQKITTVRLLTFDHRGEDVYWEEKETVLARYVAWSPVQMLLLLSCQEGWCDQVEYYSLPSVIPGRLAKEDGKINKENYQAMVWGDEMARKRKEGGAAFSLINYLAMKCTVRDETISLLPFAKSIASKLSEDRGKKNWASYRFSFKVAEEIWRLVVSRGKYVRNVAEIFRDAICEEIKAGFGEIDEKLDLERQAVDMLEAIKCSCSPPSSFQDLPSFLTDARCQRRLNVLLQEWESCYAASDKRG